MVAAVCPDENALVAHLDQAAPSESIRRHLDTCASCQALVAIVVRGTEPSVALAPEDLAQGAKLGRFVIGERLGAGAMGVVYAAYDPQLERKIAIKVLRRRVDATQLATARLLREAQAMARLSHPAVATVHEVGTIGDELFIAMELVEGETLAQWALTPRPWHDIVRAFARAGRGLAAAHDAGIVHRDFKPTNVIVSRDGRVRVLDFGLARVEAGELYEPTGAIPTDAISTRSGAVLGTPAYMAPEQLHGEPASAASDQYSFCVALHEALHGARPPVRTRRLPRSVRRIVARGLATLPAARFSSMTLLVDALEATLRHSARWIAIGCATAAAAAIAITATRSASPAPCERADPQLAGIWDASMKQSIASAFHATGAPFAADTWQRAERVLDGYAHSWLDAQHAACRATRIDRSQTEAQMGMRMLCLDRRLQDLGALTEQLRVVDVKAIAKVAHAVQGLPSIAECGELHALAEPVPPPADAGTLVAIGAVRHRVAAARALFDLGRYREGTPIADAAVTSARAIGYKPLLAEALWTAGSFRAQLGELDDAVATYREAVRAAEAGRHDDFAAKSWIGLFAVVGLVQAKFDEGLELAAHAQAAIERMGGNPEREISLAIDRAWLYHSMGRFDDELAQATHALALAQSTPGMDPEKLANGLELVGVAYLDKGKPELALEYYARSRALLEQTFGPAHPQLGISLVNEGAALLSQHRFEKARELGLHALAIFEAAYGPTGIQTGGALRLVGMARVYLGDAAGALAVLERALSISRAAYRGPHPDVAEDEMNVAQALGALHRTADAVAHATIAQQMFEQTVGATDSDTIRAAKLLRELRAAPHR